MVGPGTLYARSPAQLKHRAAPCENIDALKRAHNWIWSRFPDTDPNSQYTSCKSHFNIDNDPAINIQIARENTRVAPDVKGCRVKGDILHQDAK